MRTVYLGTSAFAAAVLQRLYASAHRPALVVTRPDSPQGRGRKLTPPPAAETARRLGLALYQPDSINSEQSRAHIAASEPDAAIVCAYGALIKDPLLSDYRMLNVHPSLLPRWRGAAPIERAIMAGDECTGVSIMRLTAGLDSGPVCLRVETAIGGEDDYGTLAERLEQIGGDQLVHALDRDLPFVDQVEDGVTYAEKITAEDRRLDPAHSAEELSRRVRALTPHIGAYVVQGDGVRLGVIRARAIGMTSPPAGQLDLTGSRPILGCADGALELLIVQPPGKRPMPAEDYLRGRRR